MVNKTNLISYYTKKTMTNNYDIKLSVYANICVLHHRFITSPQKELRKKRAIHTPDFSTASAKNLMRM